MAGIWDIDGRTPTEKTRDALTSSKKTKIKQLIGKCEFCKKHQGLHLLELHHISEAANADGSSDKNTPGNLIVLCPICHKEAHAKNITKAALKEKIRARPEYIKSELRAILKDRPKVNGGDGSLYPKIKIPGTSSKVTGRKSKGSGSFWDDLKL